MRLTAFALAAGTATFVSAEADVNRGLPFGIVFPKPFPKPPKPSITAGPAYDAFAGAIKSVQSSLQAEASSVSKAASALASTNPAQASAVSSALQAIQSAESTRFSGVIDFGKNHGLNAQALRDAIREYEADAYAVASKIQAQASAVSSALHSTAPTKIAFSKQVRDAGDGSLENQVETRATIRHFDCGTTKNAATPEFLQQISELDAQPYGVSDGSATTAARVMASKINVEAVFHIVSSPNAPVITQQMIQDQLTALNAGFNKVGVFFTLRNTTYTTNAAWAEGATQADDTAMKTALRQGTYQTLNLYFQSNFQDGVLGICTLPTNVGTAPTRSTYIQDGCNIAAGSMPNGPILGYNQGKTAVHETGHWLGLLHTFEGYACTGKGDYISDTPLESVSTDGCPTSPWKDSCKAQQGLDPIHNFMDYSTDACYTRFTPGQQTRMHTLWPMYRQGK